MITSYSEVEPGKMKQRAHHPHHYLKLQDQKDSGLNFNSVFFPVLAELSIRERKQRVSRENFLLRELGPLGFDYISY